LSASDQVAGAIGSKALTRRRLVDHPGGWGRPNRFAIGMFPTGAQEQSTIVKRDGGRSTGDEPFRRVIEAVAASGRDLGPHRKTFESLRP